MSESLAVWRCTDCGSEFADSQCEGATACPACGASSVPCNTAKDLSLKINWHELRILTIWSDNWARAKCDAGSQRTLASILRRLDAQRPEGWPPLTLSGEIRELQAEGYNAELRDGQGNVIVPSPKRGSA